MTLHFSHPRYMTFAGNSVTDHNRGQVEISTERIENKQRMADGTMRKWYIADKRTFTIQWDNLPSTDVATVDGYWGATSIENFYKTTFGSFALVLTHGDNTTETYTVMIDQFSKTLISRGNIDLYQVNIVLEEV